MEYVCDAPGRKTWFRIESENEALVESETMRNSIEIQYESARRDAIRKYLPSPRLQSFERDIGLKAHLQRTMPMFLTLRDREGTPLANATLPPCGEYDGSYTGRVIGPNGTDALVSQADAVGALERHFGLAIQLPIDVPIGPGWYA